MTIDQEIARVLEKRIGKEPGPHPLVTIDEDLIYPRYRQGGILKYLSAAFASCAQYISDHVIWYRSRNHY